MEQLFSYHTITATEAVPGKQYYAPTGEPGKQRPLIDMYDHHAFVDIVPPVGNAESLLAAASRASNKDARAESIGNIIVDRKGETETWATRVHVELPASSPEEAKQRLEAITGWLTLALSVTSDGDMQQQQLSKLYRQSSGK